MTLTLKHIGRRLNQNWIIKDLSFHVDDGECLAILGPSGCGKSSTLRIVAGLDIPSEGSIYINNINITQDSPLNRKVGMVFQSYALFPHLSVSSNLSLGLKVRGISKKEQIKRVNYVLALMQLEHLSQRLPSELSGGQRQRVALARALLREPLVYLLDEPMSNLDAQLREELRPELRNLILKGDQAVLYVTHDQQEAMAIADRVALLNNGQLEQIGRPEELYKNPQSIFAANFIGRPQINLLPVDKGIIKGIRPENIIFDENGINCKISHIEWLGINQLVYLDSHYGQIRMICDSHAAITEQAKISWKERDVLNFDALTGKRVNIY